MRGKAFCFSFVPGSGTEARSRAARCIMGIKPCFFRFPACSCLVLLLLLSFGLPATAEDKDGKASRKEALVLLTFGTTYEQKADALEPLRQMLKKRYPDMPLFTAYTSTRVVSHLREQGKEAKTPAQALADLSADGYTHVVMQSLHVIPGLEYEIVREIAGRFNELPKGLTRVSLGLPLLGSHEDARTLAGTLAAALPKARKKGEAVVYVGHGAAGATGSLAYPALAFFLQQADPHLFVGTIEGPFDLENTLAGVKASKVKKVWLVPLLTVVGDHAVNDIFGNEDDSWKTVFAKAGLTVETVPQGLAFVPGVADIWAAHAEDALKALREESRP